MSRRPDATALLLAFALAWTAPGLAAAKPTPTSCGAVDLMAELRRSEPEAARKVAAAAAAVPNGEGLLWRIDKQGLQPSYLFGTMHSTDPRLDAQMRRVRPLIARSRAVAVEIGELVTPGLRDKAAAEIAAAGVARSGNALEGLWPQSNRAIVEAALLQRGISPDRAQRYETWFLVVALSSPQCERERRQLGLISVDEKVGLAGSRAGRAPIGLETLEDQIAVLRGIGGLNPSLALIDAARNAKAIADIRETMTRAYVGDRLGELAALSRVAEVLRDETPNAATSAFTRSLIDDRNLVMRDRSLPLLARGGAFIAVGALHLPGDTGLVALYRRAGYAVSVVKP